MRPAVRRALVFRPRGLRHCRGIGARFAVNSMLGLLWNHRSVCRKIRNPNVIESYGEREEGNK
jgi:hypothetical protein